MLTVFDPQKALASLHAPLVATETTSSTGVSQSQSQYVKLTAGLHRQIWINGSSIFVDIHIINRSSRMLGKVEIQLQKTILWYTHAAAGTGEKNANHLRIPQRQESKIVAVNVVKKGKDWKGIPPETSDIQTCQIHVPREHVTITTGRFFEVRFFLDVIVTITTFKTVAVQLPVTIIHMNSLDIMPNPLAQVAASIEAKRARMLPVEPDHIMPFPYHQGQAFIAAQRQSLELQRNRQDGSLNSLLEDLKQDVDVLPRKHKTRAHHPHYHKFVKASTNNENKHFNHSSFVPVVGSRTSHDSDCYHCHLNNIELDKRPLTARSQAGPKLPRLQVSTSGLGFTESEFSLHESPPKKVMLSEREKKMISQQMELQTRTDYAESKQRNSPVPSQSDPRLHPLDNQQAHMNRRGFSKMRSKTLDQPINTSRKPGLTKQLSNGHKRASTGSDQLYTKPAVPRDQSRMARMSSKKRGKLPADPSVL